VSVPLVLLVVALVIWLAQSTHFHLVSPAALMAVAGIGVMAAALIAEAPAGCRAARAAACWKKSP
jgi:hypothetical protein